MFYQLWPSEELRNQAGLEPRTGVKGLSKVSQLNIEMLFSANLVTLCSHPEIHPLADVCLSGPPKHHIYVSA